MVMAPRIAEHPDVLLPVLVCQDGFTITHSAEPVDAAPGRARCATFVGEYHDPVPAARPAPSVTTQGPFAMPDYYFELKHQRGRGDGGGALGDRGGLRRVRAGSPAAGTSRSRPTGSTTPSA